MAISTFSPNGYNSASGSGILESSIIDILSSDEYAAGLQENLSPLGIVTKIAVAKDQVVTGMTGSRPVEAVGENEPGVKLSRNETYKKAIEAKEYVAEAEISRQMLAWIEKTKGRPANDPSVAAMLADMKDSVKFLGDTLKKTMNVAGSRLYGKGSSITASSGAGSASPDGKALFATDHVIKFPSDASVTSYSNALSTALDATNLLAAINHYRLNVRDHDGSRLVEPEAYTVIIPRDLRSAFNSAVNAINGEGTPSQFAGSGSNSNLVNPFYVGGQKVNLVVDDWLGQTVNGVSNGSATNWFLLNRPYALDTGAMRCTVVYDKEVKFYYDFNTRKNMVSVSAMYSMDHFNPAAVVRGNV